MRSAYLFIAGFLLLLVMPLISIVSLSLQDTQSDTWHWYGEILHTEGFLSAAAYSIQVAAITALLTAAVAFVLSLAWFVPKQRAVVFVCITLLALIPPDILSLSISQVAQLFHIMQYNILVLLLSLVLYALPFGVLILWARFYYIDEIVLRAANDLGMRKAATVWHIILPLSTSALSSVGVMSFLLAFNEYTRTSYLSGAYELLSEYLSGKLSTGTTPSIYAGGSLMMLITVVFICILAVGAFFRRKQAVA